MPPPTMRRGIWEEGISDFGFRISVVSGADEADGLTDAGSFSGVSPTGAPDATDIRNPKSEIRFSRSEFAHHLYYCFHVLHRCLRQDSVAQVEDVARAGSRALEQVGDVEPQFRHRREENGRIQIALD